MRTTFVAAMLLLATPSFAAPPTPIAFETIVSLDKFHITNLSESASLFQLQVRPGIRVPPPSEVGITLSHGDMLIANQPPWPGDDFTGWYITRQTPGRWVEVDGPIAPGSDLRVEFVEPFTQQRGWIFAPLATGRFEGFTVPEPASVLLVGLSLIVTITRCRSRRHSK